MILDVTTAVLLTGGLLFVVFAFVDCTVNGSSDCTHEKRATYDSYHKQVCVDCLKEFPAIKGVKK